MDSMDQKILKTTFWFSIINICRLFIQKTVNSLPLNTHYYICMSGKKRNYSRLLLTSRAFLSHFHFLKTSSTGKLVKSSRIPSGYWPLNIGNSWVPDITEFLFRRKDNISAKYLVWIVVKVHKYQIMVKKKQIINISVDGEVTMVIVQQYK